MTEKSKVFINFASLVFNCVSKLCASLDFLVKKKINLAKLKLHSGKIYADFVFLHNMQFKIKIIHNFKIFKLKHATSEIKPVN